MKRYFFSLILILCAFFQSQAQGILCEAKHMEVEDGPSLQIFEKNDRPCYIDEFSMSFELSILNLDSFGYVFMLYNGATTTPYSFIYTSQDCDNGTFKFNTDGQKNYYTLNFANEDLAYQWITVSLNFNLQKRLLHLNIGHNACDVELPDMGESFQPLIYFGRHDYILDMPSMAIRNLKIEGGGERTFFFPFNETFGREVHTSDGEVCGWTSNSKWLISKSYHWQSMFTYHSTSPMGTCYHPKTQKMLFFNQDSLMTFDLEKHSFEGEAYTNRLPVHLQLATHFLNTTTGRLHVYEVNNLPLGDVTSAALDLEKKSWQTIGTASLPVQLHHHVGYWDEATQRYVIFGGFGNKRFSNTFMSYDPVYDDWDTLAYGGVRIPPRYFSGLAHSADQRRIYILGGMGNDSGEQSLGRIYMHDLYLVDVDKREVHKLWDLQEDARWVVARNMVLSVDETQLYALCYPEYLTETSLRLIRFDIPSGEWRVLGDSIPMRSDEIMTNANLYYNERMHEYYVTTTVFDSEENTDVTVYRLMAPGVALEDIQCYDEQKNSYASYVWLASILVVLGVVYRLWRFFMHKAIEPATCHQALSSSVEKQVSQQHDQVQDVVNGIYLFGPFMVIDRFGHNITHLFSTRLKMVFLYILLHSTHDGCLSAALNEVFWADKADDKVKNLKGVTINQIRKILAELDGIELVYVKGYFKIIVHEPCYCDYLDFYQRKNSGTSDSDLGKLLMRGKFLEGVEGEMLDRYKQEVESFLLSFLPLEVDRLYSLHKYEVVVRFCHLIFRADPINEFALGYCVHALLQVGLSQEAIMQYSQFVRAFKQMQGEDYSLTYSEIIERSPEKLS